MTFIWYIVNHKVIPAFDMHLHLYVLVDACFVWFNLTLLLLFFAAAQNRFENFLVCGVVVLAHDEGMDLVVLGYDSQIDIKLAVVSCELLCFCIATEPNSGIRGSHSATPALLYHLAYTTKGRDYITH